MTAYLSLLISIGGVLLYALAANPKLQEIGRLTFAVGLLAFLLVSVPRLVTVLH